MKAQNSSNSFLIKFKSCYYSRNYSSNSTIAETKGTLAAANAATTTIVVFVPSESFERILSVRL
jgi:hypothetical protein